MFQRRRPSTEAIARFISSQRDLLFTYSQVGATQLETAPPGYNIDHNRITLGAGQETFRRAVAALQNWKQFNLGWVTIVPPETAIDVGAVVAVQARTFGFWSLNACRVVYVVDESQPVKRFGFAYGTLPDHVERGEERFTIEWHPDGSVFYDIFAFSRPRHPLAKVGFPVTRRLQRRFVRDSLAAMTRAAKLP
ncbi:MAG TPA: DUF1990 domain-containing protein [Pyrinomonadaceae bacterium]|jgi:uncharacterized protein (UPF0548 family)|nr:DUF1990 domain-containing protein [Pyrinomonadaceae bacterium]